MERLGPDATVETVDTSRRLGKGLGTAALDDCPPINIHIPWGNSCVPARII